MLLFHWSLIRCFIVTSNGWELQRTWLEFLAPSFRDPWKLTRYWCVAVSCLFSMYWLRMKPTCSFEVLVPWERLIMNCDVSITTSYTFPSYYDVLQSTFSDFHIGIRMNKSKNTKFSLQMVRVIERVPHQKAVWTPLACFKLLHLATILVIIVLSFNRAAMRYLYTICWIMLSCSCQQRYCTFCIVLFYTTENCLICPYISIIVRYHIDSINVTYSVILHTSETDRFRLFPSEKWWAAEILVLLSGTLHRAQASLAAMTIFSNTMALCAMPPLSLGSAARPGDCQNKPQQLLWDKEISCKTI